MAEYQKSNKSVSPKTRERLAKNFQILSKAVVEMNVKTRVQVQRFEKAMLAIDSATKVKDIVAIKKAKNDIQAITKELNGTVVAVTKAKDRMDKAIKAGKKEIKLDHEKQMVIHNKKKAERIKKIAEHKKNKPAREKK